MLAAARLSRLRYWNGLWFWLLHAPVATDTVCCGIFQCSSLAATQVISDSCPCAYPGIIRTSRYRGSSPIVFTLRNQDKEAGVSLIKLARKMDTGDILTQAAVDIGNKKYYYRDLEALLAEVAAEESVKVLQDFRQYEVMCIYKWRDCRRFMTRISS